MIIPKIYKPLENEIDRKKAKKNSKLRTARTDGIPTVGAQMKIIIKKKSHIKM